MRAETAQAVATWAEMNGQAQSYYDNAKLLADEVVGLEFRYFDGLDWLTDWDSDALGGLPKAVEILLTIQPTYALTEQALARAEQGAALPPDKTYRLVVHLPLARPGENLPDETAATTDAASGEVVP
jgi:hypothetical protein